MDIPLITPGVTNAIDSAESINDVISIFSNIDLTQAQIQSALLGGREISGVVAGSTAAAAANVSAIQAALDAGGIVRLTTPGVYYVNATLQSGSNTAIILGHGVELRLTGGIKRTLIKSRENPALTVTSLTYSAGVCTASITAHGFAVGDAVSISWAGQSGYNGVFVVASVPDANTITYRPDIQPPSSPASATASASTFNPGGIRARRAIRNSWIINHGIINQDATTNTGSLANGLELHGVIFAHGFNCGYAGSGLVKDCGKYGVLYYAQRFFSGSDFLFDNNSDGIHGTGPLHSCTIRRVGGRCDDNMVAVGTGDYAAYHASEGDVDVSIEDVTAVNCAISPVRFFGASQYKHKARIRRVRGATINVNAVQGIVDAGVLPNGNVEATDWLIEDVDCFTGSAVGVVMAPATAERIIVDNVAPGSSSAGGYQVLIGSSSAQTYQNIICRNLRNTEQALYPALIMIGTGSGVTIEHLIVDTPVMQHNQVSTGRVVELAGTVRRLTVLNPACYQGSSVVNLLSTLAAAIDITVVAPSCFDTNYIINNNSARDVNASIVGGIVSDANTVFRQAGGGGVMTCRTAGSQFRSNGAILGRTASQTFRAYGWEIEADVDLLDTTNGQYMRNTDATSTAGIAAGLARREGGSWALV